MTQEITYSTVDHDKLQANAAALGYEISAPAVAPSVEVELESDFNNEARALLGSWTKLDSATAGQYRSIVYLSLRAGNKVGSGTGFMIGPNTVVTCGHCVYNSEIDGYWVDDIEAIPARSGSSYPYGSAEIVEVILPEEWVDDFDHGHDWAILRLDRNLNVGYLGLKWQSASYNGTGISINGYPGKVNGTVNYHMYVSSGTISRSSTYKLHSDNTNTDEGCSGGPVYIYSSTSGYTAIAIHSGYEKILFKTYNRATRITQDLYNELISYRSLTA